MAAAAEGSINLVKISTKKTFIETFFSRAHKDLNEFLMWGKEIAVKTHLRPLQPTDQPKSLRYNIYIDVCVCVYVSIYKLYIYIYIRTGGREGE